ncbi:hypothetical protein D3C72_2506560 [compost metagenome]
MRFAEAKLKELEEAQELLRVELPRTQQQVRALREKLSRLEMPGSAKKGRADELDHLERQLAELKKGA